MHRRISKITCIIFLVLLLLHPASATGTQEDKPKLWQVKISAGYSESSGNTEKAEASLGVHANRKTQDNEFTVGGNAFYSSSDEKMDGQKWSGAVRYAFSFWERKWYNFYKLEGDHDRFANIDYRVIPSLGIGYWFSDTPDWKAMAEVGAGYEHTHFRDDTDDSNEAVLIPRAFLEKRLFGKSRIKEDVFFYPSLEDTDEYRIHSETTFTNPINEHLALSISVIDDYNSNPPKGIKKNDIRVVTSLDYNF